MARERDDRELSERVADEVSARVAEAMAAEFEQLRRGLVELARSVGELNARQQQLGERIEEHTTTAMLKVLEHVEALLAATGWAIVDRIRNDGNVTPGRAVRSREPDVQARPRKP